MGDAGVGRGNRNVEVSLPDDSISSSVSGFDV